MAEGRSQKTLGTFFDELGPERSRELDIVTMDMCAPDPPFDPLRS